MIDTVNDAFDLAIDLNLDAYLRAYNAALDKLPRLLDEVGVAEAEAEAEAGLNDLFALDPQLDERGLPENDPFGWITVRHVKALKAHGHDYRFAFWEEPVGGPGGHLWIQPNKGPLVLSNCADATALKTHFPVRVSNLEGQR